MSLLTELQHIFPGLGNPYEEAKKKLIGTWCLVNDNLVKIVDITGQHILTYNDNEDSKNIPVTTLKPWLPQTGLYPIKTGIALFIVKRPVRQWNRSFHYDYYKIYFPNGTEVETTKILPELAQTKRTNIFIDSERRIWWWDKTIGYIKNNQTIVCTNKYYKQELIDWSKTL